MKKTRQIRKLNSLKSVAKPGNCFSNATMYFLEPKKHVGKSTLGWLLEPPGSPKDGRIWYVRMREEREYRLKRLHAIRDTIDLFHKSIKNGSNEDINKIVRDLDDLLNPQNQHQ